MVVSKSMISLTDDGSVTGGPSLASDGGSVPFDLPKLLGQVSLGAMWWAGHSTEPLRIPLCI